MSFAEKWPKWCNEPVAIDLAALRAGVGAGPPSPPESDRPSPGATEPAKRRRRPERNVKAMLFADVKGFSSIPDHKIPEFFYTFLNEVKQAIVGSKPGPVCRNTWGDGLYLVFDRVTDAAAFALQLLDRVKKVDWGALGLPKSTTIRIGMHAGPVFHRLDPILGRKNVFGSQVNRAARIEPVTTPGCVFVSEHFAAALAVEAEQTTGSSVRMRICECRGPGQGLRPLCTLPINKAVIVPKLVRMLGPKCCGKSQSFPFGLLDSVRNHFASAFRCLGLQSASDHLLGVAKSGEGPGLVAGIEQSVGEAQLRDPGSRVELATLSHESRSFRLASPERTNSSPASPR